MGNLKWLITLSILIAHIHPMLSNECPIGFSLEHINTMGKVCVKVNRNETFFDKQSKCLGNVVPLKFYVMKEFASYWKHEDYWVDYIRSYPDGPFINWQIGHPEMGKPVPLLKREAENGSRLCCVVNPRTLTFTAVDCEERHPRFCVIPTYENADLASWKCKDEYIPFMSPIPACIAAPTAVSNLTRKAPLRARIDQAMTFCQRHDGHLLHKGYIYSNHPEFSRIAERFAELPLGIARMGDRFFWKEYLRHPNGEEITEAEYDFISHEDFNTNKTIVSLENSKWKLQDQQHIFYNVMCEYFFDIPTINLKIVGNSYLTKPLIVRFEKALLNQEDILCFTDSKKYYPTPVLLTQYNSFSYVLDCQEDGYYWCMLNNSKELVANTSDKVLYIQEKKILNYRFAVLVCREWPFDPKDFNTQEINDFLNYFFNEEINLREEYGLVINSTNVTNLKLKRVLRNKHLLFHVDLNSTEDDYMSTSTAISFKKLLDDMLDNSIGFVRSVIGCSSKDFGDIGAFYEIGTIYKKNKCETYECVGEFDTGGYWNRLPTYEEGCTYKESKSEFDYCENRFSTGVGTTETTVTSTIPITTTPSPEEQLSNIENKLEELMNSETVSPDALSDATSDINNILNFGEEVVVPKAILTNLEAVVKKVEIPINESSVKIVQPNIAIIVGERSGQKPMIGIAVDHMDDGFEENNTHILTSETPSPSSSSEVYVKIPPASGSQTDERLSFVLFKNDNAFSVNNSYQKVNSRVISITMQTLPGQYIDINFKPYTGSVQRNETKVCAFWNFDIGENGNWSSQGCKLLPRQTNGLDTCRCTHLTHFAQIIRPDKDFGDLHYEILSIITYVGCVLSLISLIIIGLTGAIFKSWRRDFCNKIRLHLSGSIALLIITFLLIAFVNVHDSYGLCLTTAITLHYSILTSFCWMLISAVLSYQSLVQVFTRSSSHRLIKACLVGWVLPALPIIIICSVDRDIYSPTNGIGSVKKPFCYPSGVTFWLTIIAPIAVIVTLNMILLCIIIFSVFINSKIQRHGDTNQLYRSLTVSFFLFFLFGLTWIFGLLANNVVMAYLFCIAATVQGFVLFIFFVLGNKKTRELWSVKLNIREKRKFPVTSSMSKSMSRGMSSNGKTVSLKHIDYHCNTTPKFLSGNFEDSDSRFS